MNARGAYRCFVIESSDWADAVPRGTRNLKTACSATRAERAADSGPQQGAVGLRAPRSQVRAGTARRLDRRIAEGRDGQARAQVTGRDEAAVRTGDPANAQKRHPAPPADP